MRIFFFSAILALAGPCLGASITIYNGEALVKDAATLDLKAGTSETPAFPVSPSLEPGSVQLRFPASSGARALEEMPDPGLFDPEALLSRFIGRVVAVQKDRPNESVLKGVLLENRPGLRVIESKGLDYVNPEGVIVLPAPLDPAVFRPSVRWKIYSDRSRRVSFKFSYLMEGLSWSADYALFLGPRSDRADVGVWARIENNSGIDFLKARVELAAGSPHQIARPRPFPFMAMAKRSANADLPIEASSSFFDGHLYAVPDAVDLRDGRSDSVSLGQAEGVSVEKIYVYETRENDGGIYPRSVSGDESKAEVDILLKIRNSKADGLGFPLPAGQARIYQADKNGGMEWVGEDSMPSVAAGESFALRAGKAFDVLAQRTRLDFKSYPGGRRESESFKILLSNHEDSDVVVEVVEHPDRGQNWNWTIAKASAPWKKKDAQTIEFQVPVKKRSQENVRYSVDYSR